MNALLRLPFILFFYNFKQALNQMDLIIITPEINHPEETDLIHTFFANGLSKLHLRKPFFSLSDYRNFLNLIDKKLHSGISIHHHFSLLNEFPGLSAHITAQVRKEGKFTESINLSKPSMLSASFHSWNEIEENPYPFDYVFISPVFNSISKRGYKSAIDLSAIGHVKQKMSLQNKKVPSIVALGGVNAVNMGILQQSGFDGAAVLGAIWEAEDPIASYIKIKETIKGFEDV